MADKSQAPGIREFNQYNSYHRITLEDDFYENIIIENNVPEELKTKFIIPKEKLLALLDEWKEKVIAHLPQEVFLFE